MHVETLMGTDCLSCERTLIESQAESYPKRRRPIPSADTRPGGHGSPPTPIVSDAPSRMPWVDCLCLPDCQAPLDQTARGIRPDKRGLIPREMPKIRGVRSRRPGAVPHRVGRNAGGARSHQRSCRICATKRGRHSLRHCAMRAPHFRVAQLDSFFVRHDSASDYRLQRGPYPGSSRVFSSTRLFLVRSNKVAETRISESLNRVFGRVLAVLTRRL